MLMQHVQINISVIGSMINKALFLTKTIVLNKTYQLRHVPILLNMEKSLQNMHGFKQI